jgi:2-polyprenyl-6-hydroxyphenyl methylase/3-demethylubiquinone-9 3-methyltransferase
VRRPERFSFGRNWAAFSEEIDAGVVADAQASLVRLLGRERFDGVDVVDVGSGSGLFSEAFLRLGAAHVTALDLDPESVRLTERRVRALADESRARVLEGSVLDAALVASLPRAALVYSWGVLHHTGAMWRALELAATLVRPGGTLAVALYNRHWTSSLWRLVKIAYNRSPAPLGEAMVDAYVRAGTAYQRATGRRVEPARGMKVRHDVRDWLGGLPYEYASREEVVAFGKRRGWLARTVVPARGMTGCNEFGFDLP